MDRDSGQEYNACGKRDMTNFVERMGKSTEVFVGKRDIKRRQVVNLAPPLEQELINISIIVFVRLCVCDKPVLT